MLEARVAQCLRLSHEAQQQGGLQLAATLAQLQGELEQLRGASRPVLRLAPADALLEIDLEGYLIGWNHGAEQMFGYAEFEALGQHILLLYPPDDVQASAVELLPVQAEVAVDVLRRKKSGVLTWLRMQRHAMFDQAGKICGMAVRLSALAEPLTDIDKVRLHARIIEDSEQGVLITDADERIVSVNSSFSRITGYSPFEAIGRTPDLLRSGVHDVEFRAKVRAAMRGHGSWRGEIIGRRKNGELFPQAVTISVVRNEYGDISHVFSLFSDISVHKDAEARMQRMANYDTLTGLPNRCLLNQLVVQGLAEAKRQETHGALMVIDISRIGSISDTLGHEVGDQLVIAIGALFRGALRDADILARVDNSKFVVALLHIEKREHAANVAQKLLNLLDAPIRIDAHALYVGASIGITVYPEDGMEAPALFRFADVAVAKAAQTIEPTFLFYREDMNRRAKEHLRLESEMRLALGDQELELHYQPKVSLINGQIVGAEALLRWKHPLRGMVSPGVFIPVAEETSLILELGTWVLDEACRQIREWEDRGLRMPVIAVNLSARQFDAHLPARVAAVLERYRVRPDQIMLEITESLLMRGADKVIEIMNELVAMGLSLALDDFGTGYSSLAYLKKFPISTLKIDRAFVIGLPYEENDCAIARAIVTMAQQLRQEIVAEGVETPEQMRFLRSLGCDQLQGYLFSPAVTAVEFEAMLGEGRQLMLEEIM
ncbi:PAS domain S-box-containing protein/diguanylate cyclase (GGDEF) domain-containing protein [Janthinobacterium psychrotolerans]|uniref:PAS domain S-box-containing protein/diguanylate cyclase (GGDEF) domain-containing protein n=1 Tax=Janthinobacterium psychrotolerans TaxID=1747903 RepID=A0A1A7BTQ0_9BURK|nr:PAS domain S-box-containing protein/diguanylate cyclase (GGDEF) domain-containing protein [Janthinobacterium psychrotolerans]